MVGVHTLSQLPSPSRLTELRHLCHAPQSHASAPAFPTNLGLDKDLPESGLARGKVHEWLGVLPPESSSPPTKEKTQEKTWSPPLSLLIHLAHSALAQADNTQARVVWIARPAASGFSVRPYSPALGARPSPKPSAGPGAGPETNLVERDLIASSLFVSASSPAQRLWATDLALRSRAAIAVIADASGFDLSATRRLQLAAEASGVLCLLTRPAHEQSVLSASTTRWLVRTCPSPTHTRRWTVALLRCKGVQPAPKAPRLWTLERDHATRAFAVVPNLRDRPHQTQPLRLTG
ncbi:MAG: hypothetical protein JNK16_02525 [Phycisphaerales bacterium]|nr:hypothetical protein [Phycisphaerales bacterium]